jgi:hypothetical protein
VIAVATVWLTTNKGVSGAGPTAADLRIGREVEALLSRELSSLPAGHEIMQRYGPFASLGRVSVHRPRYPWMLIERLDFTAVAQFERARARIYLGVTRGPTTRISRLEMNPSAQSVRENPGRTGPLSSEIVDGEIWIRGGADLGVRSSIDGWAQHPAFVAK